MTVRFRLFGAVEATVDDHPINLGYTQLRWTLAVLLVEANEAVAVDQLIDRVWAEGRLPREPRRAVHHNIWLLRRALAAAPGVALARSGAGYRLSVDTDTVDLHRFLALVAEADTAVHDQNHEPAALLLEQALSVWSGEPFAGLDIDSAWLHHQRSALAAQYHNVRLDLTDVRLRQGRHGGLLPELAAYTTRHPLDERLAGQYLLALYRSGRPAKALEHYHRLRRVLADELGTDPSPPLQLLHQQIITADPALGAPSAARAAGSSDGPTPRQLPAPPWGFIGRSGELGQLTSVTGTPGTNGATAISAITGIGGIGKTWLALHWAHQHLDRFLDGQLYVNLRGFDPTGTPMPPSTAIRGFLDALGVAGGAVPGDVDAQVGLYRSLVADKRLLVVLDNARDATQVIPLLPGSPTCTVLVTSRDRLSGLVIAHGAVPLAMDVLPDTESHDVLTAGIGAERATAEPTAVDDMVAYCAGFPLALRIVASHAQAHPRFPLTELAADLRDATTRLGTLDNADPAASLPAALSWSYRALTAEQARMFSLMGLAPGPDIGLPAAASLADLPLERTRAALRELENASLIQQPTAGRYRMHDLVRLYATDRASHDCAPDQRRAALRRVVDFYLHTAYTADRLLYPHRSPIDLPAPVPGCRPHPLPDAPAVLAWFDIEHANLLASQHIAVTYGWDQTVWNLAWAMNTFHHWQGHLREQATVWQAGLTAATHLPDPATRILARRRLGMAKARAGRHGEGIRHLHQALALAEAEHDLGNEAVTHQALAWVWGERGDDRQALEHAKDALGIYRTLDHPGLAEALNAVGWLSARLGDYDHARTHCEMALTLHRDHPDRNNEAATHDSLGYIAHHTHQHDLAIHHYKQALDRYRDVGDAYEVANTLDNLAHPHAALGHNDHVRAAWREALDLYREQGRHDDAARTQRHLDSLTGPDARDGTGHTDGAHATSRTS